jgi:hypothetical protein
VLADGHITADEYAEVYRVVEAVLPIEVRGQAAAARRVAAAADKTTARSERLAVGHRFRRVVRLGSIALGVMVLVVLLIGLLTRD